MTCREFAQFLSDYLSGELTERQHDIFEEHLAECPPCRAYLDTFKQTIELGKDVCGPTDEVPTEVPDDLVRAILDARRKSP